MSRETPSVKRFAKDFGLRVDDVTNATREPFVEEALRIADGPSEGAEVALDFLRDDMHRALERAAERVKTWDEVEVEHALTNAIKVPR